MIRAKRRKPPPWSREELAILADIYPREGIEGAADALPERSWGAITMMAAKLQIRSPFANSGRSPSLDGDRLEEAIAMREDAGWSFARIGRQFGLCETAAQNAVLIALCPRKGFVPAERDNVGNLLPEGVARVRAMLAQGEKGVDICAQLGLSAAAVSRERRAYAADLDATGMVLPPPGGGRRYSGAKIEHDVYRQVDALLMQGYGAPRIAGWTRVSQTHVQRRRLKLVRALALQGRCLPGCDGLGKRIAYKDSLAAVSEAQRATLRAELLKGTSAARAAKIAVVGSAYAYDFRLELKGELERAGRQLPATVRLGRNQAAVVDRTLHWLPSGKRHLMTYRRHLRAAGGDAIEAKRRTIQELMPTPAPPATRHELSFEDLLAAVARGEVRVVEKVPFHRPGPEITLGGVATGML